MVVKTGIPEHAVVTNAKKDITAQTVLLSVLQTVRRVVTWTDCVLVRQGGWGLIVLQNVPSPMVKIVNLYVVNSALTGRVTYTMEVARLFVRVEQVVYLKKD